MSRLSAVKGKEERNSIYCVPNSNAPGSYSVHSACWAGAPLKSEGLRDDFSEALVGLGLPFQIYALGQEGPIGLVPYVQEGHRDLNLRQVVPSLMSFPSLPGKDFGFVLFCLFFFPHVLNHTQHPQPSPPSVLPGSFTQVTFLYSQPPACPPLASCGHIGVFTALFLKSETASQLVQCRDNAGKRKCQGFLGW